MNKEVLTIEDTWTGDVLDVIKSTKAACKEGSTLVIFAK